MAIAFVPIPEKNLRPLKLSGLPHMVFYAATEFFIAAHREDLAPVRSPMRTQFGPNIPVNIRPKIKRSENLSHCVVAVNPDPMVASPTPMPGNPDIIARSHPISWTMDVIGPITYTNIDYNCFCWRRRKEARHRCQN